MLNLQFQKKQDIRHPRNPERRSRYNLSHILLQKAYIKSLWIEESFIGSLIIIDSFAEYLGR